MTGTMKRKKPWFDTFKRADIGTGLVISAIGLVIATPANAEVPLSILALYMLIFLGRKPRDEYAFACWLAGCSAAFVAVLFAIVVAPFVGGMISEFTNGYMGTPPAGVSRIPSPYDPQIDRILFLAPTIALLAFFVGFQWRRFRGV